MGIHETVFRTIRDRVLKVGIQTGFGLGLLENACWTLLCPVFRLFMTGFEVGFDSWRCCPVFTYEPMIVFWS